MAWGWAVVVGVFAAAWGVTLASNLQGGPDGTLYPVTAYPMFSGGSPTAAREYWVQAGNATDLRIPVAQAFDEDRAIGGTLAGPWARLLLRLDACAGAAGEACADLGPTVGRMAAVLQARLGLPEAPDEVRLVVRTVPLDGAPPSEAEHVLG